MGFSLAVKVWAPNMLKAQPVMKFVYTRWVETQNGPFRPITDRMDLHGAFGRRQTTSLVVK